jgi:hypothetical protein
MTTTPETHTFNFTPASIVQRTLASFSFRKDAFVTIGVADGRLYFQAEADDCTLRTSQPADWCAPGAQFAFAVEARIATKLHTLFPYAVQASYGDETFSVSHENSTIRTRAWPVAKSPVRASTDEAIRQSISSQTLKSALDFILPFAKPNRLHREESDLHFQGNAIISGKGSWAAAIVTFATDFTRANSACRRAAPLAFEAFSRTCQATWKFTSAASRFNFSMKIHSSRLHPLTANIHRPNLCFVACRARNIF